MIYPVTTLQYRGSRTIKSRVRDASKLPVDWGATLRNIIHLELLSFRRPLSSKTRQSFRLRYKLGSKRSRDGGIDNLPPEPRSDDVPRKDFPEAEHDTVHEG